MAVGDYLFSGDEPPPLLQKALNYERWGIGDINRLPAGLLTKVNTVLSYYHAIRSYQSAGKVTTWSKSNPEAWKMVSYIISERMERKRGNRDE